MENGKFSLFVIHENSTMKFPKKRRVTYSITMCFAKHMTPI